MLTLLFVSSRVWSRHAAARYLSVFVVHVPPLLYAVFNTHAHTHTHWYPSRLLVKDQRRKLSCKNGRLKQFLCLLVPLLDTYLIEKLLLHFMKKIAVRPSKAQHAEVHTVYSDLYS